MSIALIVLGVCVYALGMVLFETYRDGGVAPVGWFYLISYGTLCFMGIIYPVATLLLDLRGSIDG